MKDAYIVRAPIGNGIHQYSLFIPSTPQCLGYVQVREYGNGKKSFADVEYAWTLPSMRRQGVRTRIQQERLKNNALIYTTEGQSKSAIAWMKKNGYKYNKDLGK